MIFSKTYDALPFCEKDILRYAGVGKADKATLDLLEECISEVRGLLRHRVCWRVLEVSASNDTCDFGIFSLSSRDLAKNLSGCSRAIVFAATVGIELDRLISKYSRLSPSKALIFQAIGAEQAEALCDAFLADIKKEYTSPQKPRFSPGYGDLPLGTQKYIFTILDCERRIGITLGDSLLMSPSKSVTAFVGLCDNI